MSCLAPMVFLPSHPNLAGEKQQEEEVKPSP